MTYLYMIWTSFSTSFRFIACGELNIVLTKVILESSYSYHFYYTIFVMCLLILSVCLAWAVEGCWGHQIHCSILIIIMIVCMCKLSVYTKRKTVLKFHFNFVFNGQLYKWKIWQIHDSVRTDKKPQVRRSWIGLQTVILSRSPSNQIWDSVGEGTRSMTFFRPNHISLYS